MAEGNVIKIEDDVRSLSSQSSSQELLVDLTLISSESDSDELQPAFMPKKEFILVHDSPVKDRNPGEKRKLESVPFSSRISDVKTQFCHSDDEVDDDNDTYKFKPSSSQKREGPPDSKLNPDVWADIPILEVDHLPYDINGLKVYRLQYNKEDKFASTVEGRAWHKYTTSRRSGFQGQRILKSCKGSYRCCNELCPYRKQYKEANRVQFQKKNLEMTCSSCGALANYVPCDTRKIWEFPSGAGNKVTVYHYGVHSCIAVKPTISTSVAQAAFHQINSAKPGRMVNNHIIDAIESEKSLEETENLTDSLLDKKSLQRKKLAASQKLDPVGHSYDAVMHYKAKVEKVLNDPYLIYKVDCEKKIVFKIARNSLRWLYKWIEKVRAITKPRHVMWMESITVSVVI